VLLFGGTLIKVKLDTFGVLDFNIVVLLEDNILKELVIVTALEEEEPTTLDPPDVDKTVVLAVEIDEAVVMLAADVELNEPDTDNLLDVELNTLDTDDVLDVKIDEVDTTMDELEEAKLELVEVLADEVEILTAVVEVVDDIELVVLVPPVEISAAVGILATLSLETIALAEAELGSLLAAKLITTFSYDIDLLELVETGK